ncbi:MAG: DedA family protein [Solirubrobacteraceae bacterium]
MAVRTAALATWTRFDRAGYPGGWSSGGPGGLGPTDKAAPCATIAAVWRSVTAAATRLAPALLHIHLHLHLHLHLHRFHGSPVDYVGLAVASLASWVGLPGPGEPVLIAAGVLAARHRLDLAEVILVAFAAATAGGIIGWLVGLKAGRALVTARGPLHAMRIRVVERGEAIFKRYPVTAILITPAFVAGINGVRSAVYQPVNVISAAVWAAGLGAGGYLVGPPVLEWFDDIGTGATIAVVAVGVAIVGIELARRHRRASR